jgi:hypothetical protein
MVSPFGFAILPARWYNTIVGSIVSTFVGKLIYGNALGVGAPGAFFLFCSGQNVACGALLF